MSIASTLAAIKALPNLTATYNRDYREYRVAYTTGSCERVEATAYYTDDAEDALGTAQIMASAWKLYDINCSRYEDDPVTAMCLADAIDDSANFTDATVTASMCSSGFYDPETEWLS